MSLVEQAVFTSLGGDRSNGYHVVARSPGLCEADARELVAWGPSHDSLLTHEPEAVSVNFHPLPSGAYCISRSSPAGWDCSGHGSQRVYTQCLIVPPEVLARFANNPLALVRAAEAAGLWEMYQQVPSHLEPLMFSGAAASVDTALLGRLAIDPGPQQMAILLQTALDSICVAADASMPPEELMAGLLNCLPTQFRPEFSFSTGLKFSSRRPFRLVPLPRDPAEQCWLAHQNNVSLLDLRGGTPARSLPLEGWARLIGRVLATGQISFLAAQLAKQQGEMSMHDLDALGLQLLEELDAVSLGESTGAEVPARSPATDLEQAREDQPPIAGLLPAENACGEHATDEPEPQFPLAPAASAAAGWDTLQRAHAAHRRFAKSGVEAAAASSTVAPSRCLDASAPAVLEKLEYLDDLVYAAINGCSRSLEALAVVWPEVLAELGDALVAESREEYLRYALAIWEQVTTPAGARDATRAVQALDVLCILFDEA